MEKVSNTDTNSMAKSPLLPSLLTVVIAFLCTTVSTEELPYYCAYCECKNTSYGGLFTDCSGKGLFKAPRSISNHTTELHLANNLIKTVKYEYFAGLVNLRFLDLSHNTIKTIEKGAFRDLVRLECLLLHGQKSVFFMIQNVYVPGVFEGLQNLKILYIHDSMDFRDARYGYVPSASFMNLTSLEILKMDGVVNATFDDNFNALENLTVLEMSGEGGTCEIEHLSDKSFVGLFSLKRLSMIKCHIQTIAYGTFQWLRNLEYLDLSWNTDLGFEKFGLVAEDLKFNTPLKYLNISAIHDPNRAGIDLLRSSVRHLRTMKVIEIQMNDNGIEFVDFGVFSLFPSTLKRLYLRGNKMNFGMYLEEAIFNNPNLTMFDAGDQQVVRRSDRAFSAAFDQVFEAGYSSRIQRNYDSFSHRIERRSASQKSEFRSNTGVKSKVLQKRNYEQQRTFQRSGFTLGEITMSDEPPIHSLVKRSDVPRLELRTLICSGSYTDFKLIDFENTDNNITYMDLSSNFIPKIQARAFAGLPGLVSLNLSLNYIEYVHQEAFDGLVSLEILDLRNNLMGITLQEDRNGRLFQSLGNLRKLFIARNRIYRINEDVFEYLYNLEVLDLSENFLESIDLSLTSLSKLKLLDLSFNRLQTLPSSLRMHLNSLTRNGNITVDIYRNTLVCNCAHMNFVEWLYKPSAIYFRNREEYYCSLSSGEVLALNETWSDDLEKLKDSCVSYFEIIVACSTLGSFVCAIVISYFVYYYRWKLRYMYYMAKVKLHHDKEDEDEVRNPYEYDAFLSYGDGDRVFVTEDMRINLENISGRKLNIRDRDFELGEAIAVNISRAIHTSKRTFLLVSKYFLKNKWCNFEMNMAIMEEIHQQRKVIVVIFLEAIPPDNLPFELIDLLRKRPNLDIPKDPELMEVFWHKCTQYIHDI